jgi:hypothetical protein
MLRIGRTTHMMRPTTAALCASSASLSALRRARGNWDGRSSASLSRLRSRGPHFVLCQICPVRPCEFSTSLPQEECWEGQPFHTYSLS